MGRESTMKKTIIPTNQKTMPSVLDKEISDQSKDAFGHKHYADVLANLIEAEHHLPPFSIGLLGSWGTGKSTIKELYIAALKNDQTGTRGKRRKDRIHTITFNAWRYGGDANIKRALLRHAFIELGGDDIALCRELYQQVSQTSQTRRSLREWLKDAALQNIASVIVFFGLLFLVMGTVWIFAWLVGLSDQLGLSILGTTAVVVAGFFAKFVVDIRLKSPTFFSPQTTISFPSTSAEEYERLLVEQIHTFRKSKEGHSCERLVVFVDDLDRLSATEMVTSLDAIRTFLELPLNKMPKDFGVIFVISCDEDRVAEALARGRGRLGSPDLPGSVFTRSDARRYLDRLFQFRLEIPPFPKLDMRQFAEQKLREAGAITEDIEKRGVRLQDLVDRLIHVGVQSPRNAIQILNAFMQTWWVAVQRERSGIGSNAPGTLHEGAVTEHPLSLAALCVLRVDFPDFFNEVQKRPELIQEFNRIAFRTEKTQSLAVGAQEALNEFLVKDSDGQGYRVVRPEHRSLRQYLSSLQGLRWPKRLQPLLLLAEDSITRQYGDHAAELNDAFVSGDTQGVLEVFGHHLDTDDLGTDDVRSLEELAEAVSQDTEVRRINAARVLAGIVERIPTEYRKGLMTPLARQMIDIKDVRMNVGPKSASKVIQHATKLDRQEVADRFSSDLLTGEELQWRLPSGEMPNLDEMVKNVRDAVDLVLDVRRTDGLFADADRRVRSWLLSREIHLGEGSQTLPFSDLESWVDEHADHLLEDLAEAYTDQAIIEFETNSTSIVNMDDTIRRIEQVHHRLAGEGQESRENVWVQLTRMVAVQPANAVSSAWNAAAMHADLASGQQASEFLRAMSGRLEKELENDTEWLLDWEEGAKKFLDLITQWANDIDSDTCRAIVPLLISWSDVDECAEYMVRVCETLEEQDRDAWNTVMEHLVEQPLDELPWASREFVASKLGLLSEGHKTALVSQMDQLVNADSVDPNGAKNYRKFIYAVPASEWASPPLQAHVSTLLNRLVAMFNQRDYLSELFPAGRQLLGIAPKGRAGSFLQQLFEQAAGAPATYPLIHREMIGVWPEETDETGTYGPTQVAQRAIQFIKEHPAIDGIGHVFESVVDLVDRGLVAEAVHPEISNAATVLWPQAPSSMVSCIGKIADFLSPADMKKILTGKQPSNLQTEDLQAIADIVAEHGDEERCMTIANEILSAQPKPIDDRPDGSLDIWMKALQSKEPRVLKNLLEITSFNDDQRERVLRYAISRNEILGLSFFTDALPTILKRTEEPKTLAAAVAKIDNIAGLARTDDQKSDLFGILIPTLPALSNEPLVTITRLIRQLGGKGALERNREVIEQLGDDQLAIVSKEMPNSRALTHVTNSRKE
jgi:hypothetical protein